VKHINYVARYHRRRTAYALAGTATIVALFYPLLMAVIVRAAGPLDATPAIAVCALVLLAIAIIIDTIALSYGLQQHRLRIAERARREARVQQERFRTIWNRDTVVLPVVKAQTLLVVPRQHPTDDREWLNLMRDYELPTGEIKV
jgi:hypothetical protein